MFYFCVKYLDNKKELSWYPQLLYYLHSTNYLFIQEKKFFYSKHYLFLSVLLRVSWAYQYIYVLCTRVDIKGPLGGLSEKSFSIYNICICLKCTSKPGLRSFCKPCSPKFRLNIQVPITVQRYGNTCGCDTVYSTNYLCIQRIN